MLLVFAQTLILVAAQEVPGPGFWGRRATSSGHGWKEGQSQDVCTVRLGQQGEGIHLSAGFFRLILLAPAVCQALQLVLGLRTEALELIGLNSNFTTIPRLVTEPLHISVPFSKVKLEVAPGCQAVMMTR